MDYELLLYFSFALVAFIYASVGHGGASGYLAVMALASVAPAYMKTSSLAMNLCVSLLSFISFYRSGYFKWHLFWPFAITSIPFAFLGGKISLSDDIYKKVLAACLIISILRLVFTIKDSPPESKQIPLAGALIAGAIIGLISGLIGIGGGIILTPLLLIMSWGNLKQTAAVSAPFIFVNSLAGLLGQIGTSKLSAPPFLIPAIIIVTISGFAGAYFGANSFKLKVLKWLLLFGLSIATLKLIFT